MRNVPICRLYAAPPLRYVSPPMLIGNKKTQKTKPAGGALGDYAR